MQVSKCHRWLFCWPSRSASCLVRLLMPKDICDTANKKVSLFVSSWYTWTQGWHADCSYSSIIDLLQALDPKVEQLMADWGYSRSMWFLCTKNRTSSKSSPPICLRSIDYYWHPWALTRRCRSWKLARLQMCWRGRGWHANGMELLIGWGSWKVGLVMKEGESGNGIGWRLWFQNKNAKRDNLVRDDGNAWNPFRLTIDRVNKDTTICWRWYWIVSQILTLFICWVD